MSEQILIGCAVKDTPDKIQRKFRSMLLKRSGEERLKMGCSMRAAAVEPDELASNPELRGVSWIRFAIA